MKRILFVDDTRTFPPKPDDDVNTCRTSKAAVDELEWSIAYTTEAGPFDEIWLDFDLGGGVYERPELLASRLRLYDTAMPVALWLAEQAFYGMPYKVDRIMIHTGNPVGREAMGLLLRRFGYDVVDVTPHFG